VQWGLKGKAEKGMGYSDMLSFYYGGLRPEKVQEPDQIRVSLATDLDEIIIERNGQVRVDGATVPDGPIKITGGPELTIAGADPIAPRLKVESVTAEPAPDIAGATIFNFKLSAPANVFVEYKGPQQGRSMPEPRQKGAQSFPWDPAKLALPSGAYEVTMVADDGVDEVHSDPVRSEVAAPSPSPSAPAEASPENPSAPDEQSAATNRAASRSQSPSPYFFIGITCLAVAAIIVAYLVFRARNRPR
jgi:hypothetical protein